MKLARVKLQDALESINVYAMTRITLKTTIAYSDFSKFCSMYLADVGLLITLSAQITDISYLGYINEQTKQLFGVTKEALFNFPKVDKYREILILMSLVYTMDENELSLLSDESNVVDTMIKYIQEALVKKEKRSNTMSLWELTDGLTKLTIKPLNRTKIAHKGALSALVDMLHNKNAKVNASAVICIHALVQDISVGLMLLEFPDLITAMFDLRNITSLKLRKEIDDALDTIQLCSSGNSVDSNFLDAVAGLNLIGGNSTLNQDFGKQSQYNSPLKMKITTANSSKDQNTAGAESGSLRPEDKKTILNQWTFLIENLDPRYIIPGLMKRGVFNADDKADILRPEDFTTQSEMLLTKLLNSGSGQAFQHFLDVLEADYEFILENLTDIVGK